MAVNRRPVFSYKGDIQWSAAAILAANTAKDGTGTVTTVYTAGADGGFINKLVVKPIGTNVATVVRVFINNGGANTTAANNTYLTDATIPATTLTEVAAQTEVSIPINIPIPASYKINVTLGTAVAAGVQITAVGGSYTDGA